MEESLKLENSLISKAREAGFRLIPEAVLERKTLKLQSFKDLIDDLLNLDFRSISSLVEQIFSPEILCASSSLRNSSVVQIISISNVSQPLRRQSQDSASRLLCIKFTDGHSTAYGVEIEQIVSLTCKTPPGTKLLLDKNTSIKHGKFLLSPKCCKLLGGNVPHLVKAWEATNIVKEARDSGIKASSKETASCPPEFQLSLVSIYDPSKSTNTTTATSGNKIPNNRFSNKEEHSRNSNLKETSSTKSKSSSISKSIESQRERVHVTATDELHRSSLKAKERSNSPHDKQLRSKPGKAWEDSKFQPSASAESQFSQLQNRNTNVSVNDGYALNEGSLPQSAPYRKDVRRASLDTGSMGKVGAGNRATLSDSTTNSSDFAICDLDSASSYDRHQWPKGEKHHRSSTYAAGGSQRNSKNQSDIGYGQSQGDRVGGRSQSHSDNASSYGQNQGDRVGGHGQSHSDKAGSYGQSQGDRIGGRGQSHSDKAGSYGQNQGDRVGGRGQSHSDNAGSYGQSQGDRVGGHGQSHSDKAGRSAERVSQRRSQLQSYSVEGQVDGTKPSQSWSADSSEGGFVSRKAFEGAAHIDQVVGCVAADVKPGHKVEAVVWTCSRCNYANTTNRIFCEACDAGRII